MLGSETMKRRCEWQTCRYSTSYASSLPPFPPFLYYCLAGSFTAARCRWQASIRRVGCSSQAPQHSFPPPLATGISACLPLPTLYSPLTCRCAVVYIFIANNFILIVCWRKQPAKTQTKWCCKTNGVFTAALRRADRQTSRQTGSLMWTHWERERNRKADCAVEWSKCSNACSLIIWLYSHMSIIFHCAPFPRPSPLLRNTCHTLSLSICLLPTILSCKHSECNLVDWLFDWMKLQQTATHHGSCPVYIATRAHCRM